MHEVPAPASAWPERARACLRYAVHVLIILRSVLLGRLKDPLTRTMATRFSDIKRSLLKLRHQPFHLCALAALSVLTRLSIFVINEPFYEGDTDLLVKGHINTIRDCINEGRFSDCPESGVFPLLQNIPALLLNYLGFSANAILHGLAYLSFLSFLGSVALIFLTLKKKASLKEAGIGVIVLITSPLLWYSHSTFGEMASAFLILAFTAAVLLRASRPILVLLLVLAGSTKEIALPFLLLIAVISLSPDIFTNWRKTRRSAGWLAIGGIMSFLVSAGFNYFRFGTISNASYLVELSIVPSLKLQLSFFLGIWLSPNGGLLFFWPSFTFLFVAIAVLMVFRLRQRSRNGEKRDRKTLLAYFPLAALAALLFFLTLGFSRWYTPLGGFAWGPRYMLPWIPTVALLLIYFYRSEIAAVLSTLLVRPLTFVITSVILILASLPQLVVLFDSSVMAQIFAYPECPRIPVIQEGVDYYYDCLQTQIWPKKLFIAELYSVAFAPAVLWVVLLYAVTVIWICYLMRREIVRDRRT